MREKLLVTCNLYAIINARQVLLQCKSHILLHNSFQLKQTNFIQSFTKYKSYYYETKNIKTATLK